MRSGIVEFAVSGGAGCRGGARQAPVPRRRTARKEREQTRYSSELTSHRFGGRKFRSPRSSIKNSVEPGYALRDPLKNRRQIGLAGNKSEDPIRVSPGEKERLQTALIDNLYTGLRHCLTQFGERENSGPPEQLHKSRAFQGDPNEEVLSAAFYGNGAASRYKSKSLLISGRDTSVNTVSRPCPDSISNAPLEAAKPSGLMGPTLSPCDRYLPDPPHAFSSHFQLFPTSPSNPSPSYLYAFRRTPYFTDNPHEEKNGPEMKKGEERYKNDSRLQKKRAKHVKTNNTREQDPQEDPKMINAPCATPYLVRSKELSRFAVKFDCLGLCGSVIKRKSFISAHCRHSRCHLADTSPDVYLFWLATLRLLYQACSPGNLACQALRAKFGGNVRPLRGPGGCWGDTADPLYRRWENKGASPVPNLSKSVNTDRLKMKLCAALAGWRPRDVSGCGGRARSQEGNFDTLTVPCHSADSLQVGGTGHKSHTWSENSTTTRSKVPTHPYTSTRNSNGTVSHKGTGIRPVGLFHFKPELDRVNNGVGDGVTCRAVPSPPSPATRANLDKDIT
ncbi:hypothetical protein Bbelb_405190 [Branchiostoma belcheri]|nr:hypothetical protein Bbelb_405190 [Branchiostoma belcheri]